ncbi:hypothetical protein NUM3379_08540 [Kineococcus sp. NUM-3379]
MGDFLVSCLRAHLSGGSPDLRLAAGVPAAGLARALHHHRVGPTAHHVLARTPGVPAELLRAARGTLRAQTARRLALGPDLERVAAALDGVGARWAVLKGPAVAASLYPDPGAREWHDLDVLVDGRDARAALPALEAAGARVLDPDWAGVRAREQGELALRLPAGTFLDLHWHLLNRPERRAAFRLDVPGILGRTTRRDLGGVACPVPDAADQLHHLALHACLSGAWRLLWLLDVALAARALTDRDALVERVLAARTALPVAMALDRSRRVLGADGDPPPVPGRPGGAAWRAAGGLVTRAAPPQHLVAARRNGHVVFSSARTSTATSARALAGALLGRWAAPPRPAGPVAEADARLAREAYLREVARFPAG